MFPKAKTSIRCDPGHGVLANTNVAQEVLRHGQRIPNSRPNGPYWNTAHASNGIEIRSGHCIYPRIN